MTVAVYPSPSLPAKLPHALLPIINSAFFTPLFPYPESSRYETVEEYRDELKSNGEIAWVFIAFVHKEGYSVALDLSDIDIQTSKEWDKNTTSSKIAATLILKNGHENPEHLPSSPNIHQSDPFDSADQSSAGGLADDGTGSETDPFHCFFLQGLAVNRNLHGHGLGSLLMKEMERFAIERFPAPPLVIASGECGINIRREIHADLIRESGSNEVFYRKRGYMLKSVHKIVKGTWRSASDFHLVKTVKVINVQAQTPGS